MRLRFEHLSSLVGACQGCPLLPITMLAQAGAGWCGSEGEEAAAPFLRLGKMLGLHGVV